MWLNTCFSIITKCLWPTVHVLGSTVISTCLKTMQITNVMAVQFQHMTDSYFNTLPKRLPFHCSPSTTSVWTFNVVMILIAIPIIDQCLHPCLRQYAPNMLKRFGISYVLLIISAGILCTYETIGHRMHTFSKNSCMFEREEEDNLNISAWLTLVPITFVSLGEIFLKVTGMASCNICCYYDKFVAAMINFTTDYYSISFIQHWSLCMHRRHTV